MYATTKPINLLTPHDKPFRRKFDWELQRDYGEKQTAYRLAFQARRPYWRLDGEGSRYRLAFR